MATAGQLQLQQNAYPFALNSGLVEERAFRSLLESTEILKVVYDKVLDCEYAIDALVTVRNAPLLLPVGIQFTLKRNCAKKRRAIEIFRRKRIVPRFLYLRSAAPLTNAALDPLMRLILDCAHSDEEHAIASAVLRLDHSGRHVLEGFRHYPTIQQTPGWRANDEVHDHHAPGDSQHTHTVD